MNEYKYIAGAVSIMDNASRYLVLCEESVSPGDIVLFHCEEGEVFARVSNSIMCIPESDEAQLVCFFYGEQPHLCEEHFPLRWARVNADG